jgi:hypothetical protein
MVNAFQTGEAVVSRMMNTYLTDDVWLIRYYALNYLNNSGNTQFGKTVQKMSVSDVNANIRGYALSMLSNYPGEASVNACLRVIRDDSSSLAKSGALSTLYLLNADTALFCANKLFESSSSPIILSAVGSVYGDNADPEHFSFYSRACDKLDDSRVQDLFDGWVLYALSVGNDTRQKVINKWSEMAKNDSRGFNLRAAAYGALGILKEEFNALENKEASDFELIKSLENRQESILGIIKNEDLKQRMAGY